MLATATQATLRKLKKAVLVEMCEARELDTEGTKEQLSQWLIEWRDSTSRSTSSASTARPETPTNESSPATKTHSGRKKISVPKLLQDHSEVADPNTPAHSHGDTKEDVEADGALDLEELGLVDKEIPVEQIQKGDKIGSGGFKDVFIGKLRGRVKVAVCEFRDELSEMDIRELKLLAEFKHPNIVRLLGIAIPERSLHVPCMVVTELCEKGDLFDYIRNVDLPPVNKVLKMMLDIAQGLTYLHDRNPRVIHRDCKSSNILITNRGVCKVGDFGLARVKNTTRSVIRSLVGTVNWQAPELWSPKPRYDYKVDVFSCAMVFWEMLAGWLTDKKKYPWEGENEHWIYLNVGQNKVRPETEPLTEHWGSDLVNLMERMWHHDPNERPLMSDVVDDLTAIMEARRRA
ncbi:hypothetical protein FFLO_06876 [Filobasidium floriforme]|uniref:Protein kinase domain-containing protein n=1 Tax=Filobasidium floriforme TaxID=5210 RepID=A0A8K0JG04_9TREE|nr:kinase-like domain-containing protein [Filobasidium floriforme]KAG7527492.1 hypothetical protein FFLO_06876 [Filobasidium floriforme]KAH8086539.1 kinase-like domain-containing protein [Filobasidium floriforme]